MLVIGTDMGRPSIPNHAERLLNVFGGANLEWQYDFYHRIIKASVHTAIEHDRHTPTRHNALNQLYELKSFVEDIDQGQFRHGELRALFDNFDIISRQSLPGHVCIRLQNPSIKNRIRKAYENLIKLEVIYYIEQELNNQSRQSSSRRQALQEWCARAKNQLMPSWWNEMLQDLYFTLGGTQFEQIYLWLTQTVPHFAWSNITQLLKPIRRFPNTNLSFLENIYDATKGIIGVGYTLFAFATSITMKAFKFASTVTSWPFDALIRMVNPPSRVTMYFRGENIYRPSYNLAAKIIWSLKLLKNIALGALLISFAAKYFFIAFSYALLAYPVSLGLGLVRFGVEKTINKLFNRNIGWSVDQSCGLSLKEFTVHTICAIAPSITPNKVNIVIEQGEQHFARLQELATQERQLMEEHRNQIDNLDARRELANNYIRLYNEIIRDIERHTGENIITNDLILQERLFERLSIPINQNSPTSSTQQNDNVDRELLIRNLIRLRANLEQTHAEHGTEVVNAIRGVPANVVMFVNQNRQMNDLPEALRQFARPANPSPAN